LRDRKILLGGAIGLGVLVGDAYCGLEVPAIASCTWRAVRTFSCDIAYSESPAASDTL